MIIKYIIILMLIVSFKYKINGNKNYKRIKLKLVYDIFLTYLEFSFIHN